MFAANTKEGVKMDIKNAERKANQEGNHVADDINEFANRAGRKVRSYYDSASNELTSDYDAVASRIRSNPVQTSLIALGVGVLLGALLRRS